MSCPETEIHLPNNTNLTCWWLSTNFALFHKKRPELDAFFTGSAPSDPKAAAVFPILKTAYEYFNGTTKKQDAEQANTIDESRKDPAMSAYFDVPDKFSVNPPAGTTREQDASEYFEKLNKFFSIPYYALDLNDAKLFDVFFFTHFFPQYKLEKHGSTIDNLISQIIRFPPTETLIFIVNRAKVDTSSGTTTVKEFDPDTTYAKIQKEILLPVAPSQKGILEIATDDVFKEIDVELQAFELDAIIEVQPGHYQAYVQCSAEDGAENPWVFYSAGGGGKKNAEFSSIDDLLTKRSELHQRTRLLMYSRKPGPFKTVKMTPPSPLAPEPVIQEAVKFLQDKIDGISDPSEKALRQDKLNSVKDDVRLLRENFTEIAK